MAVAFCPECESGISLGGKPHEGQQVLCTHCGANLEVISLRPLQLDWVYDDPYDEAEEEWDEDWLPEAEWEQI